MKHLLIMRGPSGAGKSTVTKIIRKKLKGKTAVLCSDPFYHGICIREQNKDVIYGALYLLTGHYLKNGYNVILEGVLSSRKNKKLRIDKFKRLGKRLGAKVTMVYLNIDVKTAVKRRKRKEYVMTPSYVKKIHAMSIISKHKNDYEIDVTGKTPRHIANKIISLL